MAFIFSLVALDLETGCASGQEGRGRDGWIRFASLYYYYLEDSLLAFLCFFFFAWALASGEYLVSSLVR